MLTRSEGGERHLEETKRVARLLRIVNLISAEPRAWTRARLTRKFELSPRMIDKDLEVIRNGLCYDLRRARDGYYFVRGPVAKPVEMTVPEALALALASQQARDTGTVDAAVIGSVLGKLEQALPRTIVPYLRRANDPSPLPYGPAHERVAVLALLRQAMAEGRKATIAYMTASRGGSKSHRTIAPYYLQPYERSWMAIADDSLRQAVRTFKVDRIMACQLTVERYEIPQDFDPVAYLGSAWGVLRGESGPPEDVVLRFSAQAGRWVSDDIWHPSQRTRVLPSGDLEMRFHCGVTHELVRWVLSYGGDVHVRCPTHLRDSVVAEARRVQAVADTGAQG